MYDAPIILELEAHAQDSLPADDATITGLSKRLEACHDSGELGTDVYKYGAKLLQRIRARANKACTTCNGFRVMYGEHCNHCHGTGKEYAPHTGQAMPQLVTVEQVAAAVVKNAKSGKWLSCTYQVRHPAAIGGYVSVGIKAFGLWVQRIQLLEVCDGIPEQKTQKALKAAVIQFIESILETVK